MITWRNKTNRIIIQRIVKFLGNIPNYVPEQHRRVLKPFAGIYSHIYRTMYSSIKEEILVKTPMGPYIYVRYWDPVEREIANGTYEKNYVNIFCSKIQQGDVIVDVGAYIGYFSLLASKRVGNSGCVYAFEPVQENYERMMKNLKVNRAYNVKAYNFGLSDRNETLYINVPIQSPGEATLNRNSITEISGNIKYKKVVKEIRLRPFDEFYKEIGFKNKIKIIKIDVEGAEYKVLKGMETTLVSNNLLLFMEILPPMLEQMGVSIRELIDFLKSCGFRTVYSISHSVVGMDIDLDSLDKVVDFIIRQAQRGGYNFIFKK